MEIHKKYVVYELNSVMGNSQYKALEKVNFSGWRQNSFDTEDEAIQALREDNKTFEDFVILRQVYINYYGKF